MTTLQTSTHRPTPLEPVELDPVTLGLPPTDVDAIPPLPAHRASLDLREILHRPTAFVSDLDWCIEGNARAARDHGLLPIVIGDATGAQRRDQEAAAFERITSFVAPVISSQAFAELVAR